MDLREALKWCYENRWKKLKVNAIRSLNPLSIRIREDGVVEGERTVGTWDIVTGWWHNLTDPEVTFSIPEESSEEKILQKFGFYADAVREFVKFYGLKGKEK